MFNTKTKRQLLALIFNYIILILECIGFYLSITKYNHLYFEYYTENCNILSLFSSLLFVIFATINITNKNIKIPKWIKHLRHISAASLILTFVIVLFTLSPSINDNLVDVMLKDSYLFHHFLCPIFSTISFIFFEDYGNYDKKDVHLGCSFTLVYGFIITILNLCNTIKGPYTFFYLYDNPLYVSVFYYALIISSVYVISLMLLNWNAFILRKSNNKHTKKDP